MDTVWILNLDAEDEMARPAGYRCSLRTERGLAHGLHAARRLLQAADRELSCEAVASGAHAGTRARAWCVTPSVARACQRGGVQLEGELPFEVVRAVNHRGFCARLGQNLPGAEFIDAGRDGLDRVLGKLAQTNCSWLLKRPFGVAGRGQRRVRGSAVQDSDSAWIRASLRLGGLQVEPFVEILQEFSLHGVVALGRELVMGEVCVVEKDSKGNFAGARVADATDLGSYERSAFLDAGRSVAEALRERGYRGPFGIDGFRWCNAAAERDFRPLSEINARYTLAWPIGMAAANSGPVLREGARHARIPGDARSEP